MAAYSFSLYVTLRILQKRILMTFLYWKLPQNGYNPSMNLSELSFEKQKPSCNLHNVHQSPSGEVLDPRRDQLKLHFPPDWSPSFLVAFRSQLYSGSSSFLWPRSGPAASHPSLPITSADVEVSPECSRIGTAALRRWAARSVNGYIKTGSNDIDVPALQ